MLSVSLSKTFPSFLPTFSVKSEEDRDVTAMVDDASSDDDTTTTTTTAEDGESESNGFIDDRK